MVRDRSRAAAAARGSEGAFAFIIRSDEFPTVCISKYVAGILCVRGGEGTRILLLQLLVFCRW